jgi:hypothetical protein
MKNQKTPKKQKTPKCPVCNSSKFNQGPQGKVCLTCGFKNDPNYLSRQEESFKKDYGLIITEDLNE